MCIILILSFYEKTKLYKSISDIFVFLISTFIKEKSSYAYYAKAFRTGLIENFNLFYTSNTNKINGLYSINDIDVGFSKYLWA